MLGSRLFSCGSCHNRLLLCLWLLPWPTLHFCLFIFLLFTPWCRPRLPEPTALERSFSSWYFGAVFSDAPPDIPTSHGVNLLSFLHSLCWQWHLRIVDRILSLSLSLSRACLQPGMPPPGLQPRLIMFCSFQFCRDSFVKSVLGCFDPRLSFVSVSSSLSSEKSFVTRRATCSESVLHEICAYDAVPRNDKRKGCRRRQCYRLLQNLCHQTDRCWQHSVCSA